MQIGGQKAVHVPQDFAFAFQSRGSWVRFLKPDNLQYNTLGLIDQASDGLSIILIDWKKEWVAGLDFKAHSKLFIFIFVKL